MQFHPRLSLACARSNFQRLHYKTRDIEDPKCRRYMKIALTLVAQLLLEAQEEDSLRPLNNKLKTIEDPGDYSEQPRVVFDLKTSVCSAQ